jgi:hypothetical protein
MRMKNDWGGGGVAVLVVAVVVVAVLVVVVTVMVYHALDGGVAEWTVYDGVPRECDPFGACDLFIFALSLASNLPTREAYTFLDPGFFRRSSFSTKLT